MDQHQQNSPLCLRGAPLFKIVPLTSKKNPTSPTPGIFMVAFKTQQRLNCYFSQDWEKVGRQQYTPEAGIAGRSVVPYLRPPEKL